MRGALDAVASPALGAEQSTRQRFLQQFRKTELCAFYLRRGWCGKAGDCRFAHMESELAPVPDLTKTSLCKAWLEFRCKATSDACPFAHSVTELRATETFRKKKSQRADHPAPPASAVAPTGALPTSLECAAATAKGEVAVPTSAAPPDGAPRSRRHRRKKTMAGNGLTPECTSSEGGYSPTSSAGDVPAVPCGSDMATGDWGSRVQGARDVRTVSRWLSSSAGSWCPQTPQLVHLPMPGPLQPQPQPQQMPGVLPLHAWPAGWAVQLVAVAVPAAVSPVAHLCGMTSPATASPPATRPGAAQQAASLGLPGIAAPPTEGAVVPHGLHSPLGDTASSATPIPCPQIFALKALTDSDALTQLLRQAQPSVYED